MRILKDEEETEAAIRIKGMHCATCTAAVKDAIDALEGVSESNVNLATEKVTVRYDRAKLTMGRLEEAIKGAGYDVARDELTLTVSGMHCATCSLAVEDALRAIPGVHGAAVNFSAVAPSASWTPYPAASMLRTMSALSVWVES